MNNILIRVQKKILLWVNFYKIGENFWQIVWLRVINMLGLSKTWQTSSKIFLKNKVVLDYGKEIDVSAVPVTVEIWQEKIYHPNGFEIQANDIVFDIGANIGNFALFAAKQTNNKVYAFEPVPENYELLKNNIKLNNIPNISPQQLAIAGTPGTVSMHISDVDTAHSITHKAFSQKGDIEVQAITLEQFCDQHNVEMIDFLKVDSEGAEFEMFAKMSDRMFSKINKIAIEHHERFVGIDHKEISNRLASHGFQIFEHLDPFIFAKKQ